MKTEIKILMNVITKSIVRQKLKSIQEKTITKQKIKMIMKNNK